MKKPQISNDEKEKLELTRKRQIWHKAGRDLS
jgi:hypothetical protein